MSAERAERFVNALLQEILEEQAATLGRVGERLSFALTAYRTRTAADAPLEPDEHEVLIDAVVKNVWELALQRDLIGLHHNNLASIADAYDIPAAIRRRLGLASEP